MCVCRLVFTAARRHRCSKGCEGFEHADPVETPGMQATCQTVRRSDLEGGTLNLMVCAHRSPRLIYVDGEALTKCAKFEESTRVESEGSPFPC